MNLSGNWMFMSLMSVSLLYGHVSYERCHTIRGFRPPIFPSALVKVRAGRYEGSSLHVKKLGRRYTKYATLQVLLILRQ